MAEDTARVQRKEQAVGPITFGAQIPSTEFSSLGSEIDERIIQEDIRKVKRIREWGTFEDLAKIKESKHNREGEDRCNQDGSKMLPN